MQDKRRVLHAVYASIHHHQNSTNMQMCIQKLNEVQYVYQEKNCILPGYAEQGASFLADSLKCAGLLQEKVQLPNYSSWPIIKLPVQHHVKQI